MYPVYDFLEQLGVVFQLTGDIIPQVKPELYFPEVGVRREPALKYRGLHLRHFVMPWMGMDYFRRLLDQMAKMRCNYLEFYAYVGSPWFHYANNDGETKLLGICLPLNRASPPGGWRPAPFPPAMSSLAGSISTRNVPVPRSFNAAARRRRLTAPHTGCSPASSCMPARATGGMAGKVLPRSARQSGASRALRPVEPACWSHHFTGRSAGHGDLDGHTRLHAARLSTGRRYWLWLAELYFHADDPGARRMVPATSYQAVDPRYPELRAMGYDQYLEGMEEQVVFASEWHRCTTGNPSRGCRGRHPDARFGVSVLGRSYLLPVLDALLPSGVALQSMEAAPCWNRGSRVPMENFGKVTGRDLFVVPRLDDDEHEFAMQFNVGLYDHDRVISAGVQFGLAGTIPQTGKTRGLEQNARFLAQAPWQAELTPATFYRDYLTRIFGERAQTVLCEAYRILEENELFLGLHADANHAGHCFQGMGNFCNYADSLDVTWLKMFHGQAMPFDGPNFSGNWDVREEAPARLMQVMRYREGRFAASVFKLQAALDLLLSARPLVLPGARGEFEYIINKTRSFISHLNALRALMAGFLAYDAAFRAKHGGRQEEMLARLDDCEYYFEQCCALAAQTAEQVASLIDDPTERHILFRYNVRIVLPFREFRKFIANVVNYHRGHLLAKRTLGCDRHLFETADYTDYADFCFLSW